MSEVSELKLLSESRFPSKVDPRLTACCPTIDLSVTVGDDDVLYIRRSGGEMVSKHTERAGKAQAIRWKPDGIF
jgi:hypothetical protein